MDQKSGPETRGHELRTQLSQSKRFSDHHQAAGGGRGSAANRRGPGRTTFPESGEKTMSPGAMRKIPIGVFDPAFPESVH